MRHIGLLAVAEMVLGGFGTTVLSAQETVMLRVDARAGRRAINPNIYGIVSYGLDPGFAAEIKIPNVRWGGDGTTRYGWTVDATNAGFDW